MNERERKKKEKISRSKWLETKVFRKPSKAGKVRRINIATERISAQDKKKDQKTR